MRPAEPDDATAREDGQHPDRRAADAEPRRCGRVAPVRDRLAAVDVGADATSSTRHRSILDIVDERAAASRRAVPRRHDRRRRPPRPPLARPTRRCDTRRDHRRGVGVPPGAHAGAAVTGHVRDRCDRVADVDQRPHEPLPPRRDARRPRTSPCASWRSTSCGRRCRRAASTRRARSCGSTNCSPSSPATTRRSASGRTSCRSSVRPGSGEPWGWQIDGHHLCINTVVFDGRIVMTPTFMGAEPRRVQPRPAGRHVAVRPGGGVRPRPDPLVRRRRSVDGRSSTRRSTPTRSRRTCRTSSTGGCRPARSTTTSSPRTRAWPASEMTDAQRRVLRDLAGTYVGWRADAHAQVSMREVDVTPRRDLVLVVRRHRRRFAVLLPGAQPGDPDRVRPPPRRRLRQRGADAAPRAHRRAHPERRRLRRRPAAPAPRALRPQPRPPRTSRG